MTSERHYTDPSTGWIFGVPKVLTFVNYTIKVATFHDEEYMWCVDDTTRRPTCISALGTTFIARDVSDRSWVVPPRGRAWPFFPNFRESDLCKFR